MSLDFNTPVTSDSKDEWLTPQWILAALGQFDLDPCAPINRPWDMALRHYSRLDDGLSQPWTGRVFCNPPYGRETFKWVHQLADHGDGIALTFARTETKGFHREVWERADALFFFEGRLRFYHVDGTQAKDDANAPSCLVAYGHRNVEAIAAALDQGLLRGTLVSLTRRHSPKQAELVPNERRTDA